MCIEVYPPFFSTNTQGWSKRKSLKELHSGSTCGSRQRHVGLKNGKACNVLRAAWHFVTVTVEHATATTQSTCFTHDHFDLAYINIAFIFVLLHFSLKPVKAKHFLANSPLLHLCSILFLPCISNFICNTRFYIFGARGFSFYNFLHLSYSNYANRSQTNGFLHFTGNFTSAKNRNYNSTFS